MSQYNIPAKYRKFDSSLDKIKAFFKEDDVPLTAKDEEIKTRLEAAFTWMHELNGNEGVKKMLMERFGISQRQAYLDIGHAIELFGDIVKMKKEVSRYMLYEMGMANYKKAKDADDTDQMNRSLANLIKITGVDRDDFDLPDPDKIQPPTQILSLTVNFINSEYFKHCDQTVQDKFIQLQAQIQALIDKSQLTEYLDMMNPKQLTSGD